MTKIKRDSCPKGRSTAVFACQKYLLGYFFGHFWLKNTQNTIYNDFLAKDISKTRFYKIFWAQNTPKYDFIKFFGQIYRKMRLYIDFLKRLDYKYGQKIWIHEHELDFKKDSITSMDPKF